MLKKNAVLVAIHQEMAGLQRILGKTLQFGRSSRRASPRIS